MENYFTYAHEVVEPEERYTLEHQEEDTSDGDYVPPQVESSDGETIESRSASEQEDQEIDMQEVHDLAADLHEQVSRETIGEQRKQTSPYNPFLQQQQSDEVNDATGERNKEETDEEFHERVYLHIKETVLQVLHEKKMQQQMQALNRVPTNYYWTFIHTLAYVWMAFFIALACRLLLIQLIHIRQCVM